jgi:hypothetical protein
MRPDSIEVPSQPIKPDAVSRVNPSRKKEREDRREDAGDSEEKNTRQERTPRGGTSPPGETGKNPKNTPEGKSSTRGRRLDMLV